jgi:hypothetical protein
VARCQVAYMLFVPSTRLRTGKSWTNDERDHDCREDTASMEREMRLTGVEASLSSSDQMRTDEPTAPLVKLMSMVSCKAKLSNSASPDSGTSLSADQ